MNLKYNRFEKDKKPETSLEKLARIQRYIYNQTGSSELLMIEFEATKSGHMVHDPFHDETGRIKVDPKEYYGDNYMKSDFADEDKVKKAVKKLEVVVETIKKVRRVANDVRYRK